MKGHDKIRRFILQYIKLKYNNYLQDNHIEYIDEGSIEEIVREMYLNNKDSLKTYILNSFKDQKTNFGNAIEEKTWKKDYKSCVMAVEVMAQKNPPTNAAVLIDVC